MKKAALVLLTALFAGFAAFGQATITNTLGGEAEIQTRNGSAVIGQGASTLIPFLLPNGTQDVNVRVRSGNRIISSERMSITTVNGKGTLTQKQDKQSISTSVPSVQTVPMASADVLSKKQRMQDVSLKNGLDKDFQVVGNTAFSGAALGPGKSTPPERIAIGLVQIPLLIDMDPVGQSTGKNFMQAVFKKIIVEGEKEIEINESNIQKISSGTIKSKVQSLYPFRIVIVSAGPLQGKAIKQRKFLRGKYTFPLGFNTLSIQYFKGENKYQSDVEFIVTEQDKILKLGEAQLRNTVVLDGPGSYIPAASY